MFIIRVYEEGNRWNNIFLGNTENEAKKELADYCRVLWNVQELENEIGLPSNNDDEVIRDFFSFWNLEFDCDMFSTGEEYENALGL